MKKELKKVTRERDEAVSRLNAVSQSDQPANYGMYCYHFFGILTWLYPLSKAHISPSIINVNEFIWCYSRQEMEFGHEFWTDIL